MPGVNAPNVAGVPSVSDSVAGTVPPTEKKIELIAEDASHESREEDVRKAQVSAVGRETGEREDGFPFEEGSDDHREITVGGDEVRQRATTTRARRRKGDRPLFPDLSPRGEAYR